MREEASSGEFVPDADRAHNASMEIAETMENPVHRHIIESLTYDVSPNTLTAELPTQPAF